MKRRQIKKQIDLIDYQEFQKAQYHRDHQDASHISKQQVQGSLIFQLDSPKTYDILHPKQDQLRDQISMGNQKVQANVQSIFNPFTYQIELNSEKSQQQEQNGKISREKQIVHDQNIQKQRSREANASEQKEQKTASIKEDQRLDRMKRKKDKHAFKDIVNEDQSQVAGSHVKNQAQGLNLQKNVEYGKLQEHSQSSNQKTDIHPKESPNPINQRLQVLRQKGKDQPKKQKRLPPLKHQTGTFQKELNFLYNEHSMVGLQKIDQTNYQQIIFNRFAFKTVPQGKILNFTFIREKKFLQNYYRPQYSLVFNTEKLVFSARKQWGNLNSKFNISCEQKNYSRFGNYYAGYLKGNFTGSCFNLYSFHDQSPEIVATILYKSDCSCIQPASRNIQIYLKNQDYAYSELQGYVQNQEIALDTLYLISDNAKARRIVKLVNKEAQWCYSLNAYTLDFKGKLKIPSVKNMIIVQEGNQRRSVLMVCKEQHNEFYVQVESPLNPFMAMGVILTSFDFKLCSQ